MPENKTTIYVRLDEPTYNDFVAYCDGIALTTLIRLLIKRELKLQRLGEPWSCEKREGVSKKIPIQLCSAELDVGSLLPDQELRECLRRLICIELNERWFEQAITWLPA